MRYIYLLPIISMFIFAHAHAQVQSETEYENEPETGQATLYHFKPELIQAAENCSAYQEDFTQANPDLKYKTSQEGVEQQINVNISGWEDDQCQFVIEYIYKRGKDVVPPAIRYSCSLVKDNLDELVSSMKDDSTDILQETFAVPEYDDNGTKIGETIQQATGSHFDISYAQVKSLLCTQEEFTPVSEAEIEDAEEELSPEEYAERYNLFSPDFKMSLQNCVPNVENKVIDRFAHHIEVIGKEKNRCHVKYDYFDLNIPFEIMINIHGFDDIKTLIKNKEIAKYHHKPEYFYYGLVHAYNACHNKHSYYGTKEVKRMNDIIITRGLNAEYDGKACIFNLTNDVEIEGETEDYSTMCRLTDKTIEELWPTFEEILTKYGEKGEIGVNGRFRISKAAVENSETREADEALLMYMQQEEYCKRLSFDN